MEQFRICKNCNFSGVYAIVNTGNNKIYIGSSRNIKERLTNHKTLLNHGKSKIKDMQKDFDNGDIFIAYVITPVRIRDETYNKDDDLRYFEQRAIEKFKAHNPETGYNKKVKTGSNQLKEDRNIEFAQMEFDSFSNQKHYGYLQKKRDWNAERKKFIKKVISA